METLRRFRILNCLIPMSEISMLCFMEIPINQSVRFRWIDCRSSPGTWQIRDEFDEANLESLAIKSSQGVEVDLPISQTIRRTTTLMKSFKSTLERIALGREFAKKLRSLIRCSEHGLPPLIAGPQMILVLTPHLSDCRVFITSTTIRSRSIRRCSGI